MATPIEFTPMYIQQTIADPNGFIVRSDRWNALWNLNIQQGDNNAQGVDNLTKGLNALRGDYDATVADTYNKVTVDNLLAVKENKAVTALHFKDVTFNKDTGVFTFTKEDGSFVTIDTALERVAIDVRLDPVTSELVLTLADGTEQRVSLAAFIDTYTFLDSATISWSKAGDAYTPQLVPGSIKMEHLGIPLQDTLTGYVNAAAASTATAEQHKTAAANSASQSASSAADAQASKAAAALSASNAKGSEAAAAGSKTDAANAAGSAAQSASASEASAVRSEAAAKKAEAIAGGDFATNTKVDAIKDQKADAYTVDVTGNPISYRSALRSAVVKAILNGALRQAGSGDPSPTNIRPIYGVGQFDKKVVLDGVINKFVSVSGVRKNLYYTAALAPDAANAGSATSAIALSNKYTVVAWDVLANDGLFIHFSIHPNGYVGIAFDGTMDDANTWLISHPLTIWYKSTAYPTATQVYIGFSVTDANGYHGYAAGPTAPLFDGDKLTWSGGSTVEVVRNKGVITLTGGMGVGDTNNSAYIRYSTEAIANKVKKNAEVVCNCYAAKSADDTYLRSQGVSVTKTGVVYIFDNAYANETTTDAYNVWLANNPMQLVYPLATPTTETVAISEPITNAAGLVTVESENTLKVSFGGAASDNALRQHTGNTSNPHAVTKAQVGLPNVDNTTDADKTVKEAVSGGKGTARIAPTDFLNIDTTGNFSVECMKPSAFGSDTPSTVFVNAPYTAGPFYGYREVFKSKHLITVQVTESYPIAGRVWTNTYDPNYPKWYGWIANGASAPQNHAVSEGTYGIGTRQLYGHLKTTDALTESSLDENSGFAATPKAVNTVNSLLNQVNAAKMPLAGGTFTGLVRTAANATGDITQEHIFNTLVRTAAGANVSSNLILMYRK